MEDNRPLYITRPPEGEDLYTELQRQTIAELQRLSGKVWTDYNPHDPGVTIADAANYALTEIDYKLGFGLEDYLSGTDGTWTEEMYGLFPPFRIYPTAPVTADDYRRLVMTRFPMVENVKVETDVAEGRYDFTLRLSSFLRDDRILCDQVRDFLNHHRNLCERIGEITKEEPEELSFHADFEIEAGKDATDILVEIYRTSMQYLSGSTNIRRPETDGTLPTREDEWYEGPVKNVRADIPQQRDTESELYWQLTKIPGIISFKTCYFMDREGHPVTDFRKGYSLTLPDDFKNVIVRIGGEKTDADLNDFKERLMAGYFMWDTFRTRHLLWDREHSGGQKENGRSRDSKSEKSKGTLYCASFRDVYGHSPVADDLPACYRTSERDLLRDTPAEEKAEVRNFGSYLKLFDLLMQRSLNELDGLKILLSTDVNDENPSRMRTLPEGCFSMRKDNDCYRNIAELRNCYMDFLDSLYGVDSAPGWLKEFEYYGQSEDDRLRRRMRFLEELPRLVRDRSRSFDLTGTYGGDNVPSVKKYLSLLLDFDLDEETTVGNILPGHNLALMGNGEKGQRIRGLMNSRMIDDEVFAARSVEAVKEDEPPGTKEEKLKRDEDLRRNLPIFNSNWISGSLFREGIFLNNYKLVKLDNKEWLLVFRGKEEKSRMNLGRSDSKGKLSGWANTLCRYLRELNRQCEAVYVVEKDLLGTGDSFTVMLVFTGWTARTSSPRFRKECTQLARSIIPAHLKMEIYWLSAAQMQYFEECHRQWRASLQGKISEDTRAMMQSYMMRILANDFMPKRKAEERQEDDEEYKEGSV